jgi:hypothetical protein
MAVPDWEEKAMIMTAVDERTIAASSIFIFKEKLSLGF